MTANEMFEALKYKSYIEYDRLCYINEDEEKSITFFKDMKKYLPFRNLKSAPVPLMLTTDEHKAITQQMKELGWLE